MTETDYNKMDDDLDREILEMLGKTYSSEESVDQTKIPDENQNVDDDKTPALVDASKPENESVVDDQVSEPMVPESRYKEAVRAMNKAQQELAGLRKELQGRDNLIRDLQQQMAEQSKTKDDRSDSASEVEDMSLTEFKDEYPELYEGLAAPFLKQINALQSQVQNIAAQVKGVKTVTDTVQKTAEQDAQERHNKIITDAHPDAFEEAGTEQFQNWLSQRSHGIQRLLREGSAYDVVDIFNDYRRDFPKPSKSEDTPNEAAKTPSKLELARQVAAPNVKGRQTPTNKPKFTQEMIDKMSIEEFAENEAEIDAAIARGELK